MWSRGDGRDSGRGFFILDGRGFRDGGSRVSDPVFELGDSVPEEVEFLLVGETGRARWASGRRRLGIRCSWRSWIKAEAAFILFASTERDALLL